MSQSHWRVIQPAVEPVELVAAKNHLRLEIEDDDDLVQGLIVAARQVIEEGISRSLITTGWRLTLDGFPHRGHGYGYDYGYGLPPERYLASHGRRGIKLPVADAIAVTSVAYLDTSGTTQTWAPSAYALIGRAPGYLFPAFGTSWPPVRSYPGAVVIDFTAGYGPTRADVPAFIKQAVLLLVAHLYENREATVTSSIGLREAPLGVQAMVALADWGATG